MIAPGSPETLERLMRVIIEQLDRIEEKVDSQVEKLDELIEAIDDGGFDGCECNTLWRIERVGDPA